MKKLLSILIIITVTIVSTASAYPNKPIDKRKVAHHITISVDNETLTLYDANGEAVYECQVACGKYIGINVIETSSLGDNHNTQYSQTNNNPTRGVVVDTDGKFIIENIYDSSSWGHYCTDGRGYIKGYYGQHVIEINSIPRIIIYQRNDTDSLEDTSIVMSKEDLKSVVSMINCGMEVNIKHETSSRAAELEAELNDILNM